MTIHYSRVFERQYKKVPWHIQEIAGKKERLFRLNPFHTFLKTHKLKGKHTGRWAFSVTNDYRIVFVFEKYSNVRFLGIGTHDDIY